MFNVVDTITGFEGFTSIIVTAKKFMQIYAGGIYDF